MQKILIHQSKWTKFSFQDFNEILIVQIDAILIGKYQAKKWAEFVWGRYRLQMPVIDTHIRGIGWLKLLMIRRFGFA